MGFEMDINFFKEFRKNLNLKQKEFAALLGVSEDYVSKIERGQRKISDEIEKKINKIIEDGEKPKAATLEEVCKEADEANKNVLFAAVDSEGEYFFEE